MNVAEMHTAVKLGLDKTSSLDIPAYEPEEIDLWLNIAQDRFIKQRLFGNNPKGIAFEGDQKRLEDLRPLIYTEEICNYPSPAAQIAYRKFEDFSLSTRYPNTYGVILIDPSDSSAKVVDDDFTYADANPDTIIDADSRFGIEKFRGGMVILVANCNNAGIYKIEKVSSAGTIVLIDECELSADGPGVTINTISGDDVNSRIPLFNYFLSARLTVTRTHPVATNAIIDCKLINHETLPKFLETYSNSPRFINPVVFFEGDKIYVTVDSLTTAAADGQIFYVTYIAIPSKITISPTTYSLTTDFPITDLNIGSWYRVTGDTDWDDQYIAHDSGRYIGTTDDKFFVPGETFKATRYSAARYKGVRVANEYTTPDVEEIGECELPHHTHQEIVDIAVNLMIENIESPRFGTNLEKLKTQE